MRSTMRRRRWTFLALAAGGFTISAAPVGAAQLAVDAPPSCVDPTTLAQEVADLIGRPLAEIPDVDFRVRIAETSPNKWRLHLETVGQGSTARAAAVSGAREIEGASCPELAEAASVAIAVSVRSMEAAKAAPEPAPVATRPSPDPPTAMPAAAVVAAAPTTPSWRPSATLAAAIDVGALPGTGTGLELEGDLQRGSLRLALLATWFAGQDVVGRDDKGGTFELALGGALACYAPRWGRWTPLACGGGELGRLAGTGLVARPETAAVFWRAVRVEAGATAALSANTAILLRAGVAVPFARPEFVLNDSEPVYQPSRVTFRLTAGFELGF
jgi:hypothetical protein